LVLEDVGLCDHQQVAQLLQSYSEGGGKSGLSEVDDYSGTILPARIAKSLTSSQKLGYLTYFPKAKRRHKIQALLQNPYEIVDASFVWIIQAI